VGANVDGIKSKTSSRPKGFAPSLEKGAFILELKGGKVTDTHNKIFQHPAYRRLLEEKVKLWYQKLDVEAELSTTKKDLEKIRGHHKELQDISLSVGATLLEMSSKYEAISKAVPHHRFTFLN
jgi:hypothetical protein